MGSRHPSGLRPDRANPEGFALLSPPRGHPPARPTAGSDTSRLRRGPARAGSTSGPRHPKDSCRERAMRGLLRILGVDPGSQATGYGVIDCVLPASYGTWPTVCCVRPKSGSLAACASRHLARDARRGASSLTRPDVGKRGTGLRRGEPPFGSGAGPGAGGGPGRARLPRVSPSSSTRPPRIKQSVTGSGRAAKAQMQRMVRRVLALERTPANRRRRCALAAAICHAHAGRLEALEIRRPMRRRSGRRSADPGEARAVIARLEGVLLERTPTRVVIDVQRCRLRGVRAVLDLCGAAGRGQDRSRCASTPTPGRARCSYSVSRPRSSGWPSSYCYARAGWDPSSPRRSCPGSKRRTSRRRFATATPRLCALCRASEPRWPTASWSSCATARISCRPPVLASGGQTAGAAPAPPARDQALSALLNLGYPKPQADRALEGLDDELNVEDFVRSALKRLSR